MKIYYGQTTEQSSWCISIKYIRPTSQLSKSKYRISVKGLWNKFLADSKKEIENLWLFKNKVKPKLLSYENDVIFF